MTTVDPIAINGIKSMVNKLQNSGQSNKFKMKNSNAIFDSSITKGAKEQTRPKAPYIFVPC